jgi:hypothetical protein
MTSLLKTHSLILSTMEDNFSPDLFSLGCLTQQVGASSETISQPAPTQKKTHREARENSMDAEPLYSYPRALCARVQAAHKAERIIKVWCMCGLFNEIREKVHLESRRHYTQRTQHVEPSSGHGLSG